MTESNLEARVNDHERSLNQLIDLHFQAQRRAEAEMRSVEAERDRDREYQQAMAEQIREIGELIRVGAERHNELEHRFSTFESHVRAAFDEVAAAIRQDRTEQMVFEARTQATLDRLGAAMLSLSETEERVLARVDQMQSEIRGLQTENRRILDILQNRETDESQ